MIFATTDFHELGVYASRLVAFSSFGRSDVLYYLRNYAVVIIIGCIASTPLLSGWFDRIKKRPVGLVVQVLLLLACICFLADASYNPFLYFRF